MPDYKCKLCQMVHQNEFDIWYGQSTHWICIGDIETGNPLVVYKKHYIDDITESQKEEAKILTAGLVMKYWQDIKIDVKIFTYPHLYYELLEVKNELPHKH